MTATQTPTGTYSCRFCRMQSQGTTVACPFCGAPVDVRERRSASGWEEQPAIKDMARLQIGQSTVQIEGSQVPTADFNLRGPEWIYFLHHSILWSEPSVRLDRMSMAGGWTRVRAGLPLIMLTAAGPGHIALSEDHPGELVAIPLIPGRAIAVREHRFFVATGNVGYDWRKSGIWIETGTGDDREWHYPMGQYIDVFYAQGGPGLIILHAPGNVFVRDLGPGETICIQPTSMLYKDESVDMRLHIEYPHTGGMSWRGRYSHRTVWLKLRGPGRVAVQSIFEREEESEYITGHSPATIQSW